MQMNVRWGEYSNNKTTRSCLVNYIAEMWKTKLFISKQKEEVDIHLISFIALLSVLSYNLLLVVFAWDEFV